MTNIIDFRVRPSTAEFVSIADNPVFKDMMKWIGYEKKTSPVEQLVREMETAGISLAVVQGRDLETTFGWKVSNDHVASIVQRFPRNFVAFGGVDPNKGMEAVREVQRCIEKLKFKGISMDPYMHRRYANDKKLYPVYAKCAELGVPVILTSGPGAFVPGSVMEHTAPRVIDEVAADFPELTIVVSHGGFPWVMEMVGVAMRHVNVFFDWSAYELMPGAELYVQAANTVIGDKVLYASAHPFVDFKESLKRYEKLAFNEDVREKVMYRNAARILKVEVGGSAPGGRARVEPRAEGRSEGQVYYSGSPFVSVLQGSRGQGA